MRNRLYFDSVLLALAYHSLPAFSSPTAPECTDWQNRHPDWLWCDDFESDRDLEKNYFEVNRADGRLGVVTDTAYGGTHSLRNAYVAGVEDSGSIKLSIGNTPLQPTRYTDRNFDGLYWRFYMKTDAHWMGQPMKVTRATVIASADWAQAAIGHLWEDDRLGMGLDSASGTSGATVVTRGWNDFAHLKWLGKANGPVQVYAPVNRARWQCIEVHMQLNTPGWADGIFEFWVDGRPQARQSRLNWRGSYTAYGINALTLEGWVNGGAPQNQNRYFDNFIVSAGRIGC
jgi:hypothetical protein